MTGTDPVDHYGVLGVPSDASAADIRRAYRRVARRHHPDLNRDPGGPEHFAAAARAYEVLGDPAARARYDERRRRPSVPVRRPRFGASSPAWWLWPGAARRGVLELTVTEAAHVAGRPLTLADGTSRRLVVPRGTRPGDELLLLSEDGPILLHVRVRPSWT